MVKHSRFLCAVALAACGGTPQTVAPVTAPAPDAAVARALDPDLQPRPDTRRLSINWDTVPLATDAEAAAVWTEIAATGDDYLVKLDEIPAQKGRPLAVSFLRGGNVTCVRPTSGTCVKAALDVPDPAPTATTTDPCLRRILAMWSLAQLDAADIAGLEDVLRALVAVPPPESELIAAVFEAVPESELDLRLELMAIAYRAGHRDLVNGQVTKLDVAHAIAAVGQHHIDGGLDAVAVTDHRAVFLAAVTDAALGGAARIRAIHELLDEEQVLPRDAKAALIKATAAKDCAVAAVAARMLALYGDKKYLPKPKRTQAAMMQAVCVLASYEELLDPDEPSLVPSFVPAKGLELQNVTYDALEDVDTDGDGDPHTQHSLVLIPRAAAYLPDLAGFVRALASCTGTVCSAADRDVKLTLKPANGALSLARIELVDRAPCPVSPSP